jgi:hypothetical protein
MKPRMGRALRAWCCVTMVAGYFAGLEIVEPGTAEIRWGQAGRAAYDRAHAEL